MARKIQILILALAFVVAPAHAVWAQDPMPSPAPAPAQQEPRHKKKTKGKIKDTGQNARVKVDGAAIYQFQNFDSPVLEYLDRDKKVRISRKIYPGIGGLGSFFKIRIKKGEFGYITDTDVELGGKFTDDEKKPARVRKSEDDEDDEDRDAGDDDEGDPLQVKKSMTEDKESSRSSSSSLYLTSYWGPAIYSYHYAENIAGNDKSAQSMLFGLKKSGPTGMVGGMPIDLDIGVTTKAPSYYDDFATHTSGYMFLMNADLMIPIDDAKNYVFYYGFGPFLRYSHWAVDLTKQPNKPAVDSTQAALGASVELGGAYRFSNDTVLRGTGKYVYERSKYIGFDVSVQFKY